MIIDAKGIQLDSFQDLLSDLENSFKEIYGADINLEQNTPDGQMLGIFTNAVYDLQSFLGKVYNSFDPDFAEGHELDKMLKLLATTRLPATKSIVDVTITASKNVILPDNYTLKDINNNEWIIKNSGVEVLTGDNVVSFEAKNWGAVEALPNTITKQVTIIPEIINVTNANSATVGRNEETDVELRKRRNKIIGYNAISLSGSMLSKLFTLVDVKDAIIYENSTDTLDADKILEAHTMWIIVDGGNIEDIAKIITTDKTIGVGLKGSIDTTYIETIVRADGTNREYIHNVKFDRPTITPIYIKFDVKKKSSNDIIDMQAIKNALSTLSYNIAQNITVTELYGAIYNGGNDFIASNLQISKDNTNWVTDILTAGYDEKFSIIEDNITITEIV